jgi:hypothetical protein
MDEYRAVHRAQYLERERVRLEREARVQFFKGLVDTLRETDDVHTAVGHFFHELQRDPPDGPLEPLGLGVVEALNTNPSYKIHFNDPLSVLKGRGVQNVVAKILELCKVEGGVEVEYDMDCSGDEELAARLAVEEPPPPPVRRPRGRPPRRRR